MPFQFPESSREAVVSCGEPRLQRGDPLGQLPFDPFIPSAPNVPDRCSRDDKDRTEKKQRRNNDANGTLDHFLPEERIDAIDHLSSRL